MATTTPRLEQEFRADFLVQQMSAGEDLVNFGGGKGIEVIPCDRVQVLFSPPPYLQHNNPQLRDGFGDFSITGKYRLLAANEEHGNYILTAFLGASMPTGSAPNGGAAGVITPTIAGGKGWGNFDIQSTLGVALPTSQTEALGRAIAFNTTFQYHLWKKLWPEIEINSTFWNGGAQDGKRQTFLTMGMNFGRFKAHGRVLMVVGAGYQVALTHYHRYRDAALFTIRFPF